MVNHERFNNQPSSLRYCTWRPPSDATTFIRGVQFVFLCICMCAAVFALVSMVLFLVGDFRFVVRLIRSFSAISSPFFRFFCPVFLAVVGEIKSCHQQRCASLIGILMSGGFEVLPLNRAAMEMKNHVRIVFSRGIERISGFLFRPG